MVYPWLKMQMPEHDNSYKHLFSHPSRLPGVSLPELGNLQEIKTMLAESVVEWTEQWKQQGMQQGKLEGEAAILERLLTKRFGTLPEATRTHLTGATLEQLDLWADRILEALTALKRRACPRILAVRRNTASKKFSI